MARLGYSFSNFMQRLRMRPQMLPTIAWYLINSPIGREQMNYLSTTTTGLANLNGKILSAIRVPVPPLHEQQEVVSFLDKQTARIDTTIDRARREIELMREYRTRLVSDVVTGKLDVRNVEISALPDLSDLANRSNNLDADLAEEELEDASVQDMEPNEDGS